LLTPIDRDAARRTPAHLGLVFQGPSPGAECPFRNMQPVCYLTIGRVAPTPLGHARHAAAEVLFRLPTSRLALTGSSDTRVAERIVGSVRRGARPGPVRTGVRTRLFRGR
jgi:hypothetical protein